MSVKIQVLNKTAIVNLGSWKSDDNYLQDALSEHTLETIVGYTPWPDYTLAEMACEALGGKIIEATDPPEYVEGRVY